MIINRILTFTSLYALFFLPSISGQDIAIDTIALMNPSFEDMPRCCHAPRGWYDCGFPGETAPDIQPSGDFNVLKVPQEGDTYLGMVVRDNDTWEMVAQRLIQPLEGEKCYEFSLHLSRSELYVSMSKATEKEVNYTTPAKIRIWGGSSYCNKQELLDETPLIINTNWKQYNFRFEPRKTHTHIMIEVFYKTPTLFPYNGNVLLDKASPIVEVLCDKELPLAFEEEKPKKEIHINQLPAKPVVPKKNDSPNVEPPPSVEEVVKIDPKKEKIIADLDRSKIKEGQTIRIDQLFFEADSTIFSEVSIPVLDEVYDFLASNRDVVVEIGGHTNNIPAHEYCDKLSRVRAKSVADYLSSKGIERNRLQYKGYGKRNPTASNKTAYGRKRNQRVEIKILSFDS